MKYNIVSYFISEGFRNVFKNKKSTGASLVIMCLTMFVFGACIILSENINNIMNQLEVQQPMQVFIEKSATQTEIEELREEITKIDLVSSIEFVSKEEALKINIEAMKESSDTGIELVESWADSNPFRASFVVRLTDLKESQNVENQIKKLKNVSSVQMKSKLMDVLIKISWWLKVITICVIFIFIAISTFIIVYTIKLTVYARRREISIMKYVGATNSFIRWPFIVEGVIIGIIAAMIAVILIGTVYSLAFNKLSIGIGEFNIPVKLLTFSEMFNLIISMYLILGVGIGSIGSIISMRKYLKV